MRRRRWCPCPTDGSPRDRRGRPTDGRLGDHLRRRSTPRRPRRGSLRSSPGRHRPPPPSHPLRVPALRRVPALLLRLSCPSHSSFVLRQRSPLDAATLQALHYLLYFVEFLIGPDQIALI